MAADRARAGEDRIAEVERAFTLLARWDEYLAIETARARRGPRGDDGTHYDLCQGTRCPCFRQGGILLAASHRDVLDHFCRVDPDFVRERLALADVSRDDVSREFEDHADRRLGPESAGGRDANQGAPRPPVPPSKKENA